MTAPDLLPCPFCGGKAERIELTDEDNKGGDVICCTKCQASSHVEFGRKENLVSAWNTRSTPLAEALAVPEVAALVQALEQMLDDPEYWSPYARAAIAAAKGANIDSEDRKGGE